MWQLKPSFAVIDLDSDSEKEGTHAKQPQKSILAKLEKVQSHPELQRQDREDGLGSYSHEKERDGHAKEKESARMPRWQRASLTPSRPPAADMRFVKGGCRTKVTAPVAMQHASLDFEVASAPAGPAGLCDLCNFADMETLMQHGKGRLTHLLNQLAAPEAGIALARIEDAMGEGLR